MQDASSSTHARVQFVSVVGAQSVDNALPFLASLAQGGCDLVFAAGPVPLAAVNEGARRFPHTRFVAVGNAPARPNVSIVDATTPAEVRAEVARLVTTAVGISRGA
jgi:basic membrane lipoprotein Med (substrate-binding protein (PBP1-ABC) superfamily)